LKPPAEVIPQRIDERLQSVVAALGREHALRTNANTKLISQYLSREIFSHDLFDLVVDTHRHAPDQVVSIIADAMDRQPGRAFAELYRRLNAGRAPFDRCSPREPV
jgi:cytidylate kinase